MNFVVTPSSGAAAVSRRIRVMLVDDAVVVRGLFARWVESEPDLEVVATLRTGREAVDQLERVDPDVVVLDVDMPELDGIAALPLLLEKKRDLVVIMASTLTRRNAEISLRALSLGAADYIPKPGSNREVSASTAFRRDLIEKIRQLGLRAKRLRSPLTPRARTTRPKHAPSIVPSSPAEDSRPAASGDAAADAVDATAGAADRLIDRRPAGAQRLVAQIDGVLQRAPVLITQHMPPTFTAVLAEHLARVAKRPVREAVDGEEIIAGIIYLAPGGKHMKVARRDNRRDLDRRRPLGEFLQTCGRSAVCLRGRSLGQQGACAGADGHGLRRSRAAPNPLSPPAAMSWRRTKRPAWSGVCRAR